MKFCYGGTEFEPSIERLLGVIHVTFDTYNIYGDKLNIANRNTISTNYVQVKKTNTGIFDITYTENKDIVYYLYIIYYRKNIIITSNYVQHKCISNLLDEIFDIVELHYKKVIRLSSSIVNIKKPVQTDKQPEPNRSSLNDNLYMVLGRLLSADGNRFNKTVDIDEHDLMIHKRIDKLYNTKRFRMLLEDDKGYKKLLNKMRG